MIENGHSWIAIQQYTLSEIGEFLSSVIVRKSSKASEQLSLIWLGSNITHEGLLEVTKGLAIQSTKGTEKFSTQGRVSKDVARLMNATQSY